MNFDKKDDGNDYTIKNETIRIIPNPASDEFMVQYIGAGSNTNVRVEIYSMNGTKEAERLLSIKKSWVVFDAHDLAAGVYIVRCILPDKVVNTKLVIVR